MHTEAYEKKLARRIEIYIRRNLRYNLKAADVAEHFSVSSASLQRLCRKYYGHIFQQFLEHARMALAIKYLQRGKLVKEAMHVTWYKHRSSFNRAFKRIYHHPPGYFVR